VQRLPSQARRYVTVRNGIGPAAPARPREAVRRELGLAAGDLAVLAVGSLTPQKAHATLLEGFARAARELPAARLLIAGEGPLRGALEARAAGSDLAGRVSLLGDRDDVTELLEGADLFALSSVREGLPVTLLEAMRAGRPAVATAIGGCGEAVRDGESGRIVPVGDAAALGAAIAELLRDPARRAAMGAAARARWAAEFTAARMVAETEALYARALGVPAGEPGATRSEGRRASA
jgi:glycosyltransferase involved in cell wall biosynthesis